MQPWKSNVPADEPASQPAADLNTAARDAVDVTDADRALPAWVRRVHEHRVVADPATAPSGELEVTLVDQLNEQLAAAVEPEPVLPAEPVVQATAEPSVEEPALQAAPEPLVVPEPVAESTFESAAVPVLEVVSEQPAPVAAYESPLVAEPPFAVLPPVGEPPVEVEPVAVFEPAEAVEPPLAVEPYVEGWPGADAVLADTVLADTVLADTVLADTVLADTVLADTVLADTAFEPVPEPKPEVVDVAPEPFAAFEPLSEPVVAQDPEPEAEPDVEPFAAFDAEPEPVVALGPVPEAEPETATETAPEPDLTTATAFAVLLAELDGPAADADVVDAVAAPAEPVAASVELVPTAGELVRLEATASVVESLNLGFHLGCAVERIATAAELGSAGVPALREAAWLIERYVALLERRPIGADIHASATRLARAGEAIADIKALATALDAERDGTQDGEHTLESDVIAYDVVAPAEPEAAVTETPVEADVVPHDVTPDDDGPAPDAPALGRIRRLST